MKKPDDYSKYFNEDGTSKKCPYDFFDERSRKWILRLKEIRYSLMNDKEKAMYREFQRYQKAKMESSIAPELVPA